MRERPDPDDYSAAWTPRIGPDAVNFYLKSLKAKRAGFWIATVAWPVLFFGIGLSFWPVIVLGGVLLAFNFWLLFIYVGRLRGYAGYFARKFTDPPAAAPDPPFERDPVFFDAWQKHIRDGLWPGGPESQEDHPSRQ